MNPGGRPAPNSWRHAGAQQGRGGQNQGRHLTSGSEARPGLGGKRPRPRRSPQLLQRLLARAHPDPPHPEIMQIMHTACHVRWRRGHERGLQGPAGRLETRRAEGWEALPRGSTGTPVTAPTTYRAPSASEAGIPAGLQRRHPHAAALPGPGGLRRRPDLGLLPPVPGALVREGPAPATPFGPASFPPSPRRDQSRGSVWKISQWDRTFPLGGPASQSRLDQWELERSSPRRCRGRVARGSTKRSREGRCGGRAFYTPPLHRDFFARMHFVGRLQN